MPDLSTGLIVYDFKFGLDGYSRVKKKKIQGRDQSVKVNLT